jgi:protoheme IX farnesyltransferase
MMQKIVRQYVNLAKPGIIMGNGMTAVAGFAIGSYESIDLTLMVMMLIGLSLIIGSGCVFNNCIDRIADSKMTRTRDRPLVTGNLSVQKAIVFGIVLGLCGAAVLAQKTNLLTLSIAMTGFFVYVMVYTLLKYKTRHGTLIGGIAGAVPPLVGYTAVHPELDLGALLLFAMMFCWQMPHFYAIAIFRSKEYEAAGIPVYPIIKGIEATKWQMLLFTAAFVATSASLTLFGYAGYFYLGVALAIGLGWLILSLKGFKVENDVVWARRMFIYSLLAISAISIVVLF